MFIELFHFFVTKEYSSFSTFHFEHIPFFSTFFSLKNSFEYLKTNSLTICWKNIHQQIDVALFLQFLELRWKRKIVKIKENDWWEFSSKKNKVEQYENEKIFIEFQTISDFRRISLFREKFLFILENQSLKNEINPLNFAIFHWISLGIFVLRHIRCSGNLFNNYKIFL